MPDTFRPGIFAVALLAVVILLQSPLEAADSARGMNVAAGRYALVIGNGAYPISPLKNPTNDSADMARLLKRLDFEVVHLQNAGLRDLETEVRAFGRRLKAGGTGVFYYAGHGMQVEGRNYLIPVDAHIESESDVRFEALDAGRVLGKMEDAGNDLNIVILDACRDNPFTRSFRSAQNGLARMDAPRGTLIAYATAPGSVAADGLKGERNGVYTKHLLKYLATPGLSVEQAFKNVRIGVLRDTGSKQVPWESSSLTGNFYFAPAGEDTQASVEALFWQSIRESNNPDLFHTFLIKFPDGAYADMAAARLQALAESGIGSETPPSPGLLASKRADRPIQLRATPGKITQDEVTYCLQKYDFFEKERNRTGSFKGLLVETQEGLVRDKKTGLIWTAEKSGTKLTYRMAKAYIKELNQKKFGGYSDWRLPTIEELASLLRADELYGAYTDGIFQNAASTFWSADQTDGKNKRQARLIISFNTGGILLSEGNPYAKMKTYNKHTDNYVRPVRTAGR